MNWEFMMKTMQCKRCGVKPLASWEIPLHQDCPKQKMSKMNWEFIQEKVIPVAWLFLAFIFIGIQIGVWLR